MKNFNFNFLDKDFNFKQNLKDIFFKLKNNFFTEKKLNIIFMGTPLIAVPFLEKLYKEENVLAVFTAPDRPKSRYMRIKESDVKIKAKNLGLKIFQPKSLNTQDVKNIISSLKPDLILIVAYGYLVPEEIIKIPKFSAINIHFSLFYNAIESFS